MPRCKCLQSAERPAGQWPLVGGQRVRLPYGGGPKCKTTQRLSKYAQLRLLVEALAGAEDGKVGCVLRGLNPPGLT